MAELIETIKGRRSIRRYEDRGVPDEALNAILESVQWAQSWANTQCWEIVVVKDPATKKAVQEAVPTGNPSKDAIVSVPVLLAIRGRLERAGYYKGTTPTKFGDWFMFDLGIASQNIALTAHALGLGTVIVGMLDQEKAGQALNVPEGCELVALMPLGYPAEEASPPKRREIADFVHSEGFE